MNFISNAFCISRSVYYSFPEEKTPLNKKDKNRQLFGYNQKNNWPNSIPTRIVIYYTKSDRFLVIYLIAIRIRRL